MHKLKEIFHSATSGKSKHTSHLKDTYTSSPSSSSSYEQTTVTISCQPCTRMIQNFLIIWLDGSIDEVQHNDDCYNTITQLRKVVNTIHSFTDANECINFINGIKNEKAFLICSGSLGQTIVPIIHDKPQIGTIYIFCGNQAWHETWAKQWRKVNGVYTDIIPICEALKQATKECNKNMVSISFVKSTEGNSKENLDELDRTFMYTQILKEILLTIDFKQEHVNEFLTYCRQQLVGNTAELENVDKFEREYHDYTPIWWYTYNCFLYSMLNRALRMMEVDIIIKMGFFLQDLHKHIDALYSEQFGKDRHTNSFTVYRGQSLAPQDFDRMLKTKGGLLSFNNFLSTSLDREVSLQFGRISNDPSDLIDVLFEITVNPSISSTIFANIRDISFYQLEDEILFSMHSIFRIGEIKQIEENNYLWQVQLTLTSDNDPILQALTKSMQEETKDSTGWDRLGSLMVRLGQFNTAEQLYETLLPQATKKAEKRHLYNQLGMIKDDLGKYDEAIKYYEKLIKSNKKVVPPVPANLAASYNNIGLVYLKKQDHSKALSYCEKALEIGQTTLPPDHPSLATSYNNIGLVYDDIGEYSKALWSHEHALEIYQKILPPLHPDLATLYGNIGSLCNKMREYSKALLSHEKALEIQLKILPPTHPHLAFSFSNMGSVYAKVAENVKALALYERAYNILQRAVPENHPDLIALRNKIISVKNKF